jgi:hypothetical protein
MEYYLLEKIGILLLTPVNNKIIISNENSFLKGDDWMFRCSDAQMRDKKLTIEKISIKQQITSIKKAPRTKKIIFFCFL